MFALLAAGTTLALTTAPALAAVTATGDVSPSDPLTWTSSTNPYVGLVGTGTLSLTSGSTVLSGDATVGRSGGSTGTVTVYGSGSAWTNAGSLVVGSQGVGTLSVTNGGLVSNTDGTIGNSSGSTGTATVAGLGSTWTNSGNLYIGGNSPRGGGDGVLSILNGGTVQVDGLLFIDRYNRGGSDYIAMDTGGMLRLAGNGSTDLSSFLDLVQGTNDIRYWDGSDWAGITNATMGVDYILNYDGTHTALTVGVFAAPQVVTTGDVSPSDPLTWTSSTWAYIGDTGTGSVSVSSGAAIVSRVGTIGRTSGSTGTVAVEGHGSSWAIDDDLEVGRAGDGTLSINNGGAVSNVLGYIGRFPGAMGMVTVDGSGSTWTNRNSLIISGGNSSLSISNGGAVTVGETTVVEYGSIIFSHGTLTTRNLLTAPSALTGTGSINTAGLVSDVDLVFDSTHGLQQTITINDNVMVNLDVNGSGRLGAGYRAAGSLTISEGRVVISSTGILGEHIGSAGTATVTGTGSKWINTNDLFIGLSGNGTLIIADGGSVNNSVGYIGFSSGSTGTVSVDGLGSMWTNSGNLYVGDQRAGSLAITNGGLVSNTVGYVGRSGHSTGTVTVEGIGSAWTNSGGLFVGVMGDGTLLITNGGAVSNSWAAIGDFSSSTGAVTVDGLGSRWTNSSSLCVGSSGTGSLLITNGGAVSNATGSIGRYSGSTGTVTVDGPDSTWTNSNDLYIGGNPPWSSGGDGTLTITNGGLVEVGGTLYIDINNRGGTDYIALATGGMLKLAGDGASDIGAFLGLVQGTDDIRYWAGSGWDHILNATMGLDYTLSYDSGFTLLTVGSLAAPIMGDLNGDGVVDDLDLATVQANLGMTEAGWGDGDFDGDGVVSLYDAYLLFTQYAPSQPTGSATTAIPEPASLALLGLGGLTLMRRREA